MENTRFDNLTRALARPIARRQLLKMAVAGAVGGLLMRGGTEQAVASDACTQFCQSMFTGKEALQCTVNAMLRKGLCYSPCGPHRATGASGTLCGRRTNGHYTSYDATTCCAAGVTCGQDGTCAATSETCRTTPQFCLGPRFEYHGISTDLTVLNLRIYETTSILTGCVVNATVSPLGVITPPYPDHIDITVTKIDPRKPSAVEIYGTDPCGKKGTLETSF